MFVELEVVPGTDLRHNHLADVGNQAFVKSVPNVVASAGFEGVVRLSDAKTGKVVKEFIPVPLTRLAKAR